MKTIHLGSPNEEEERSQHILYEHKEVMTGIFMKGKGMSEHDDSRKRSLSPLAHQTGLQEKPEQPRDPIIRWERCLPDRTLNVLLVENDDSTRQVVGALLRNCSYEGNELRYFLYLLYIRASLFSFLPYCLKCQLDLNITKLIAESVL